MLVFIWSCVPRAVFTALVGIAVPFFGGLLGFFGGFAFAPTTYYVRSFIFWFFSSNWFELGCSYIETSSWFTNKKSDWTDTSAAMEQLPCILWLKIKKPKTFSFSWFANWVSNNVIKFCFFLHLWIWMHDDGAFFMHACKIWYRTHSYALINNFVFSSVLHHHRRAPDGVCTYWRSPVDHRQRLHLQVLLVIDRLSAAPDIC